MTGLVSGKTITGERSLGFVELGHELDDSAYLRFVGRSTEDCESDLAHQLGAEFPMRTFHNRWPDLWRACANEQGIARQAGCAFGTAPLLLAFLGYIMVDV
jgi:hypothetical protein